MGIAEELREKARSLRSSNDFVCKDFVAIEFGISSPCKSPRRCCDCYADMFERIADRIDAERALPEGIDAERALPEGVEWPRFEDGELVKVGDEVEFEGETMRVFSVAFTFNGWVLWCARESFDGRLCGSYGELVKRPTPKVLGADGAPIKVGDKVYFVGGSGARYTVKDIGFKPDGAFVDIIDEGRYSATVNPESLTHERPDSWERLEEDAAKPVCEYAGAQKSIVDADRYTCLNCPYDEPGPHTDAGCNERMRLDLVSRAKALAKKEEA